MKTKKTTSADATFFKGDAAHYTGNTDKKFGKLFYEIMLDEGAHKGETRVLVQAPCALHCPTEASAEEIDAIDLAVAAPEMPADNAPKAKSAKKKVAKAAPEPKPAKDPKAKKEKAPRQVHHQLEPGRTLTREFKGQQIVVNVTKDGLVYNGETYSSISACAKAITGYGISGPVFFRLDEASK